MKGKREGGGQMSSEISYSIERSRKDEENPRPDVSALPLGESGESEQTETRERLVMHKIESAFARHLPRTYQIASKVLLYLRGPRPKRDLDPPVPFLSLPRNFNRRTHFLSLEPAWIRLTRFFTHPLLFVLVVACYIVGLTFFTRAQWFQTPSNELYGCADTYWLANSQCGLDGQDCLPTEYGQYDFRCPAGCDVILQNPRTVGNEEQKYVPLIVGGGDANRTYRGDSFVCSAAVQAGIVSFSKGGCGSIQLVANYTNFIPTNGHGLDSIGFPTVFPIGFRFSQSSNLSRCTDNRMVALAMNIILTSLLFLLFRPRPIVLFWCLFTIGYWHIIIFSQPRTAPPSMSDAFADFLPGLFIGYGVWRVAFRFVLPAFMVMPLEATVWYIGPFWVGVLANVTFNKIPINRLLASDIRSRPGALTALLIIVVIVLVIIVNQARVIRKTGWLPHYLGWYLAGGLVLLVLALLPGLTLRLHHYIVALVLLPSTAFPTRLSAVYQAFLLGLVVNDGAAFGWDSILQTAAELRQDATLGSVIPTFLTNSTTFNSSVPLRNTTLFWESLPPNGDSWDGFSLLIDDVERLRGTATNFSLALLDQALPHFFRLAFTSGNEVGDYTNTASYFPNGTWVDPQPGSSY